MSNDGQNNDELNQNTQTALPNEGASINRRSLLKGVMGAAGVASLPSFVFPALAQGERLALFGAGKQHGLAEDDPPELRPPRQSLRRAREVPAVGQPAFGRDTGRFR